MAKIVQRVINHKYISIKEDLLIEGTVVPFDCYIKRFGDYVIIIEAGTLINKNLYEKIRQNHIIYVLKHDYKKVEEYLAEHHAKGSEIPFDISKREIVAMALGLKEKLASVILLEEQLSLVYTTTALLMQEIFETKDEMLPFEALHSCVEELVGCVDTDINVMPLLLKMMPKEYTTHHHSVNVAFFAAVLCKAINSTKKDTMDIAFSGLLHDIGKMRVDEWLLLKAGPLEEDEYKIMKRHSEDGIAILEQNGISNEKILNGVRYHHEKLDGTGYPKALLGKKIPKSARIIGMCDVFDALTTQRTFRTNYTSFEALLLMKREMNTQFDESFTDAFIQLLQ